MNHPTPPTSAPRDPQASWLTRNEFLWRRLHSLSGLVPVGAYMVVHLTTNASIADAPATFQENVYTIHSLGKALWLVEWLFIFLPLIFHAVLGVVIIRGGLPNNSQYPYARNMRYLLQRVTGMIAFVFIFWHVFHMHGWFHFDSWLESVAKPLGGAQFRPYNAATSLHVALQGFVVQALYAIGMLSCVFHLANGLWTMGITWGVWVSPQAQNRANWACTAFGIGLAIVGLTALGGARNVDLPKALAAEDAKFEAKLAAQNVQAETAEHKRFSSEERQRVIDQGEAAATSEDASSESEE